MTVTMVVESWLPLVVKKYLGNRHSGTLWGQNLSEAHLNLSAGW